MSNPRSHRAQAFQFAGRCVWLGLCTAFLAVGCGDTGQGDTLPPLLDYGSATGGVAAPGSGRTTGGTAPATGGASVGKAGAPNGGAASGGKATGVTGGTGGSAATGGTSTGATNAGGASAGGTNAQGATGGMSRGGASVGGKAAGGSIAGGAMAAGGAVNAGGTTVGGAATGGKGGGGRLTGGAATGGAAAGGAVTGGNAAGGAATGGTTTSGGACSVAVNRNPFNCKFGWGSSNQSSASYQNFITRWTGMETDAGLDSWSVTGTNSRCDGCSLASSLASTNAIPAFYTYFIAGQARARSGFGDCNVDMTDGHNLCTDGAAWILSNRDIVVRAYAEYAKAVEAAAPGRASLWLLEGDLSQYVNSGEQVPRPLTWAELGQLVSDITCAIKTNHPNAMAYINHSYWLDTSTATSFFSGMPMSMLDGLWMGGGANLAGKLTPATYTTVTYAWLYQQTGLPLYVGGQGASQQNWATATVADLNARIADGVVAADIDPAPSNAESAISGFATTLDSTCN